MGRLVDCDKVFNAIQITTDNFGVVKHVVESNMQTMLSKIPTVRAIRIPEGATNGDVIKAMFPSAIETDHFILNSPVGNIIYIRLEKWQEMRVQEDWWNAPFKRE